MYDFEEFGQTQMMEASESLRRVGGGALLIAGGKGVGGRTPPWVR